MAPVYIQLTPEGYKCLLGHFSPGSSAHECLTAAVKFIGTSQKPDWYTVKCDLEIAEVLLGMASNHCLSAVKNLEHAIRELKHRARKR